jgi:hypothetical protein
VEKAFNDILLRKVSHNFIGLPYPNNNGSGRTDVFLVARQAAVRESFLRVVPLVSARIAGNL